MKEKLHTIPVNEAFDTDCECPVCVMRKSLETKAIDFTMGPSYMEDDVRGVTSQMGFCKTHVELLYKHQNRLGLALILKSHMDKVIKDVEKKTGNQSKISVPSLFKKKGEASEVVSYLEHIENSCYICSKIDGTFERYIATIFHLYHNEDVFRQKFNASKGFCTEHYNTLSMAAPQYLSGEELNRFITELNTLFLENLKRVRDDLDWFIDKFDYRYANEPWKNSKDALPRTLTKMNHII
ncbi:hypothetical protein I5677_11790 [Mobilitalea sibirica]|uniref:ABC transporter substrate-binding protein n=1 Tax=Mobilitalea sibirica TaxID=1462919 RepID=A0A8J7HBX3_9FIRM|nr:DUF6062 family protein [Mobilitalea sibirica]MBH1941576.1 hypothetical protein [Mobilitalea sibirica]